MQEANVMLDSKGFDLWANDYDKSVNLSEESDEYPFAGYKDVLNYIYNRVMEKPESDVLDIGFGTGILTSGLYNAGCKITGIDFSSKMIDIAKKKMPNAELIKYDFSKGLPCEIMNHCYDFIISTYAIHHLSDKDKIKFIKSLSALLNKEGMILIGDVSFNTRNEMEKCKEKYRDIWDFDEFYFIAEEISEYMNDEFKCMYTKISQCAGVMMIFKK